MLMPKMKGLKGLFQKNKHRRRFGIKDYLAMVLIPLALLFVIFIATDNFMLYWFVLMNNDEDLEARRREDFHWYDSSGQSYTPGSTGSSSSPGYVEKYDPENIGAAIEAAISGMSVDEIATKELAWRCVVYAMDQRGFVPKAICGMLSYMRAEAGGGSYTMGTYTYQRLNSAKGPSGVTRDRTEDNAAWLKWLSHDGPAQVNKSSIDIGIGLVQSTDIYTLSGSSYVLSGTTHNATDMINAAEAEGRSWQNPAFQVPFYVDGKFTQDYAWDLDQNPGPDPKSSTEITATEWAGRAYCGIGMPGWSYVHRASINDQHYLNHIAHVDEATEFYNQYSGKDPLFYNSDGSLKYAPQVGSGESDWHNPFSGPAYDNTTPQGLMIARCALMLAGRDRSVSGKLNRVSADNSYNNPEMAADPGLRYYREAKMELESTNNHFASCDRAASTAVMLAGVDPSWVSFGGCSTLISHCKNSSVWERLGKMSEVQLQPGDVLFENDDGYHIAIWIGENVAGERFPGTTSNVYQASLEDPGNPASYFPDISQCNPKGSYWGNFVVYRCKNPVYSGTKWEQFRTGRGSSFTELPTEWAKTTVTESTSPTTTPSNQPIYGSCAWVLPIDCKITSNFGMRILNGKWEGHRAYDFRAPEGTALYSPVDGIVLKVTDGRNNAQYTTGDISWGNYITIQHPDGKVTLYAHLMKGSFLVAAGDKVKRGQQIAQTGNTGNSFGAHLHLELWPSRSQGGNADMMDCLTLFPGMPYTDSNGNKCTVPAN